MIRGETQTIGATITWLVTFSVGDHHDSHGRYAVLANGFKKTKSACCLSLFDSTDNQADKMRQITYSNILVVIKYRF